jgi:hypothetical protein
MKLVHKQEVTSTCIASQYQRAPDSVLLVRLLTTAGACSTCPKLNRCCCAGAPLSCGCTLWPSGPSKAQSWSAFSLLDAFLLMRREAACELPKLLNPGPMFVAVLRCSNAPAPPADADTCGNTARKRPVLLSAQRVQLTP